MKFQKDIKLILSNTLLNEMGICIDNAYPNEACGLVFGQRTQVKNPEDPEDYFYDFIGEKFECIESDKKSAISFLIENLEKLNQIYQEAHEKYNMKLVSIFHSHPSGNHPSGVDKENMTRLQKSGLKSFQFIIWTIMDGETKDLNGFMILNDEIVQIEVIIKNSKEK
ncbi:MAG: hypothetical protein GF311_12500 [Candidatus Lokiarchaeota archaeon]|nr:hypothetical protein [Candidatus Lokiarchaeota archaeon]